jgi:hypothetical protein
MEKTEFDYEFITTVKQQTKRTYPPLSKANSQSEWGGTPPIIYLQGIYL